VRLEAAAEGEARAPSADGSAPRALAQARASLPALRVLVVDDDEFNRLVLRRTLPTPPFTLATAVNGRAALEAAERQWPDVVLLDLEMPVMDGYAAAAALRAMEAAGARKPLTIVAVSSNDEQAIIDKALAAGCDHYLTKPAPREALWRILQGVPGEAAPAAALADPGDAADAVLLDPDLEDSLPSFLATRRAMLEEMPGALEANERGTFRRLAHKLAGSFSLFGFAWASAQCRALERDALHGDARMLRARVEAVRAHLASVPVRFKPAAGATEGA
jgi:CheY-like chemotaxis protein/HPt (histidine-containing phosphotransfer) domain-containing protein